MPEGPEVKIASTFYNEFFNGSKNIQFEILTEYYEAKYFSVFDAIGKYLAKDFRPSYTIGKNIFIPLQNKQTFNHGGFFFEQILGACNDCRGKGWKLDIICGQCHGQGLLNESIQRAVTIKVGQLFSAIIISLKGQYAPLKFDESTGGSLIFTNNLKLVVAGLHVFGATIVTTRA